VAPQVRRRKRWLPWLLAALLGVLLGLGSAWVLLTGSLLRGAQTTVGSWSTSADTGSTKAHPYLRAATSIQGLFVLRREEATYWVAYTDDSGESLRPECTYQVSGGPMPAAWWSITVYDTVWLVRNTDGHASIDATSVGEGAWSARLSPTQDGAAHWLSSRDASSPNLALRLYAPQSSTLTDPTSTPVPTIRRISCGGAS
jgi:hypothetical protein